MPVAERVVVEMISTELVPARKPVVSTDVALTEMSSAVVDAGKMTSADVTTPEVSTAMATAAPVSTTMTASGVATAMTTTTVTTTTVTTTAMAAATPMGECRDVRHDAKRAHRNAYRQNTYCFLLHDAFPNRSSKTVVGAACGHRRHLYFTLNYYLRREFLDAGVPHYNFRQLCAAPKERLIPSTGCAGLVER